MASPVEKRKRKQPTRKEKATRVLKVKKVAQKETIVEARKKQMAKGGDCPSQEAGDHLSQD